MFFSGTAAQSSNGAAQSPGMAVQPSPGGNCTFPLSTVDDNIIKTCDGRELTVKLPREGHLDSLERCSLGQPSTLQYQPHQRLQGGRYLDQLGLWYSLTQRLSSRHPLRRHSQCQLQVACSCSDHHHYHHHHFQHFQHFRHSRHFQLTQ